MLQVVLYVLNGMAATILKSSSTPASTQMLTFPSKSDGEYMNEITLHPDTIEYMYKDDKDNPVILNRAKYGLIPAYTATVYINPNTSNTPPLPPNLAETLLALTSIQSKHDTKYNGSTRALLEGIFLKGKRLITTTTTDCYDDNNNVCPEGSVPFIQEKVVYKRQASLPNDSNDTDNNNNNNQYAGNGGQYAGNNNNNQ